MSIGEVGPEGAYDLLREGNNTVLVDVRTAEEFERGHPEGAVNIPVALLSLTGMEINSDFIPIALANIPKDVRVFASCQSGQRSMLACQLMEQAGWSNPTNVRGGFSGARDVMGNVLEQGWSQLGLPVGQGQPVGCSYVELKARAENS